MADLAFTAVTLFWMFIGAISLAGFSTIMLLLLALTTPAMSFFKAKIKKNPLLAARRNDRKIDFVMATQPIHGLAINKKYGGYFIDPEGVYSSLKGGVSILPVNSEIGISLTPDVLGQIDALKREGIDNIEEAEFMQELWGKCTCGYEGVMTPLRVDDNSDPILVCPINIQDTKVRRLNEEVVTDYERGRRKEGSDGGASAEPQPPSSEDGHADNSPGEDVELQRPEKVLPLQYEFQYNDGDD